MVAKKAKTRFKKDQRVVYPSQGVGKIIEIMEQNFHDATLLYYKIYLEFSDMTVLVPVDKAVELGLREIVPKEEAEKALKLMTEEFAPLTNDWKERYKLNLDLLKKGSVLDTATVVRALHFRSKIKELPVLERKLYESALNLLQDEIAYSLHRPKEEIRTLIKSQLDTPSPDLIE